MVLRFDMQIKCPCLLEIGIDKYARCQWGASRTVVVVVIEESGLCSSIPNFDNDYDNDKEIGMVIGSEEFVWTLNPELLQRLELAKRHAILSTHLLKQCQIKELIPTRRSRNQISSDGETSFNSPAKLARSACGQVVIRSRRRSR